jgi:Phosphotransferase enzyme family
MKSGNDEAAILAKIFFPGQQNVQLLQDSEVSINGATCLLAFGNKWELPGWHCLSFGYINNPDGGIRWLYPIGSRNPYFLKLYNGSGWRSSLFKTLFSLAFRSGRERLARSGTLHVYYKNQLPLGGLVSLCPSGNMAIFTGTVGENRKAVVALEDQEGRHWFYKQPLTKAAGKLTQNEASVLAELSQYDFQKIVIPNAKPYGSGLMVTDVKPTAASNSFDLQPIHFEAVGELAQCTLQLRRLGDLPFWKEMNEHLKALQSQRILNDLSPDTVRRVIAKLLALRSKIDPKKEVPTALAHGDFTPWNMYLGNGQLHVYDWELSERLPLLYDAFHFVFQSGVLVKRQPYKDIQTAIFSMKNKEVVQQMLAGQGSAFEELYQLYLLRNTSYYLLKYLRQKPLHTQAHWQLAAWDAAL